MRELPAAGLLLLLLLFPAMSAGQEPVINTHCPVMPLEEVGEDAESVTYRGTEVRLCCKKCVRKFLADPERYLARLPQFAASTEPEGAPGEPQLGDPGPWRLFGKAHPVAVHFPIALLFVALALEFLALTRRKRVYGPATRPLVLFSAMFGIVAAGSGLVHAEQVGSAPSLEDILFWHRGLGIAVAILASGVAVLGEATLRRESRPLRAWYLLALLGAVLAVGLTGHLGGLMVFGPEYWGQGG